MGGRGSSSMSGRVAAGGNTTNTGDGFWKVGYDGKTYEHGHGSQMYTFPLEGDNVPKLMRDRLLAINAGQDSQDYIFNVSMADVLEAGDRGHTPIFLNDSYGTFSVTVDDMPGHVGERTSKFNQSSSVTGLAGLSLGKTYVIDRVGDTGTEAVYLGTVRDGYGASAAFYTSSSTRKLIPVSNGGRFEKGNVFRYTGDEKMTHNGVTRYRNDRKNPGRKRA